MRNPPGVSPFRVRYKARRGKLKGWLISYVYYKCRIGVRGKTIFLGNFPTMEAALAARMKAKQKYGV